jgi:hypothetical protein
MKQSDVLETIDWSEGSFGSLITNNQCSRRDVMRAVKNGLAKSIGQVLVCDDDGCHIDPEQWREGFVLTDKGRAAQELKQ